MISRVSACGREHKLDVRPSRLAPASSCEGGRGAREVPGPRNAGPGAAPAPPPGRGPCTPGGRREGAAADRRLSAQPQQGGGPPTPEHLLLLEKTCAKSVQEERFFQNDEQRPEPASTHHPGASQSSPTWGRGQKVESNAPWWSEGGGEGV